MSTIVCMRHFCTRVTSVRQLVLSGNETCYTCTLSGHACTMHVYTCAKNTCKWKGQLYYTIDQTMSGESASSLTLLRQTSPDFGSPGTERCQTSEPEEVSYGSSAPSTPFSQDLTPKTPKRQRKTLIFDFYEDIVVDDLETKAKCNKCCQQIQGKYGATSNFVTHLKVCDCFIMSLWIKYVWKFFICFV